MLHGANALGSQKGPPVFALMPEKGWRCDGPRSGFSSRMAAHALAPMQIEGLVHECGCTLGWRMASDEGPHMGGHDAAPFPPAYFFAGLTAAYLDAIALEARARDATLSDLQIVLEAELSMSGSLLKKTKLGEVRAVRVLVKLKPEHGEPPADDWVRSAIYASPFTPFVTQRQEACFSLSLNQVPVETGRVTAQGGPVVPPPKFDVSARIAASGSEDVVERLSGPADTEGDVVSFPPGGMAVAGNGDASLVRVFGTLAEDGGWQMVQYLFNPKGSINRLRARRSGKGGGDMLPGPLALMSAGLGFCFATQLGRYVQAADLDISGARCVQDLNFGAQGCSIATHVHLFGDESGDAAREILDMAEQTCFLHALGRAATPFSVTLEQA